MCAHLILIETELTSRRINGTWTCYRWSSDVITVIVSLLDPSTMIFVIYVSLLVPQQSCTIVIPLGIVPLRSIPSSEMNSLQVSKNYKYQRNNMRILKVHIDRVNFRMDNWFGSIRNSGNNYIYKFYVHFYFTNLVYGLIVCHMRIRIVKCT